MNNDINIMIKLQEFWDIIVESREKIENYNSNINGWQNELENIANEIDDLSGEIKKTKASIKEEEIELKSYDNKIMKIEERKELLKTEREINAQKTERERIENERDTLEENMILQMDELDKRESTLFELKNMYDEKKKNVDADTIETNNKINQSTELLNKNQQEFDIVVEELKPALKQKFVKLLNSKGKAISEVRGEICNGCNFTIPASLASDAAKDDKISVCSNCSRYIYK